MTLSDIRRWLVRVIAWDGVLPVVVWAIPFAINKLFPNHRGAVEFTAVVLPIVAFFVRGAIGLAHIHSNHCGPVVRALQSAVFCVAVFALVFVDCICILLYVIPENALAQDDPMQDPQVLWLLFGIYLAVMGFAMYPGRDPAAETPGEMFYAPEQGESPQSSAARKK